MTSCLRSSKRCRAPAIVNAKSNPIKPNMAPSTVASPAVMSAPLLFRYRKPRCRPQCNEINEPTKKTAATKVAKNTKIIERSLPSKGRAADSQFTEARFDRKLCKKLEIVRSSLMRRDYQTLGPRVPNAELHWSAKTTWPLLNALKEL